MIAPGKGQNRRFDVVRPAPPSQSDRKEPLGALVTFDKTRGDLFWRPTLIPDTRGDAANGRRDSNGYENAPRHMGQQGVWGFDPWGHSLKSEKSESRLLFFFFVLGWKVFASNTPTLGSTLA